MPCKAQQAFDGVIDNFPNKFIGRMLYRIIFPLGKPYDVPSDKIGHQVAKLLIEPNASRDRLTAETYVPMTETEAVGAVEMALKATLEAEPIDANPRRREEGPARRQSRRQRPRHRMPRSLPAS